MTDWSILVQLARAWPQPVVEETVNRPKGQKVKSKGGARRNALWEHDTLPAILVEIARVVPAYADVAWDALGNQGRQTTARPTTNRRFQSVTLRTAGREGAYPLILVTGTQLFDGGTLVQATAAVAQLVPAPFVGLNAADATRLAMTAGQAVTVSSPVGQVPLVVRIDASVLPGTAWVPWGQLGEPAGALLADKATINVKVE